jgi:hypothetical protein
MSSKKDLASVLFTGNPIVGYLFILIQLSLLFFAFWQFNIEEETKLTQILPVILGGFAIHFWLPKKLKLPFFLIISFASILVALGVLNGLVLIGVGALLILTCHLPIKYNLKLLLLALITSALILFRANIFVVHPIPYLIPFIGTMFMLRLIIYVYDLKYDDSTSNIWQRIAYFFLLPNVCFPLFPLVDFKILKTTYYNKDRFEIYAIGIRRIFRGAIHILTYRILYYLVVPDPSEIDGLYSILQFVIFSYTLILRLSGMYHISLGVLSLFGFNLPEIFNNYFFASSFNNIWKRINIYWREALMKVFYYPIYFKIRKVNKTYAVAITILIVFVLNWAMHGYQWFWVRGSFPLEPNDFLFWMVFGTAVMVNSIYLQKIKEPQKLGEVKIETFQSRFYKVIKPIGMFAFMSSIWLMWSSSSLKEWMYLLSFFGHGTSNEWLIVMFSFLGLIMVLLVLSNSYQKGILRKVLDYYDKHLLLITFCCVALLFTISFPKLTASIKVGEQPLISFLQENKLSDKDKKTMERGYYQKLLTSDNNALKLSQVQLKKPKNWYNNDAYYKTNDLLRKRFKRNYATTFKNAQLRTNSWGMRDKEYSLSKNESTYRIALLGGSYEMGAGVNNEETFEALIEQQLNQKYKDSIEILNFAIGGYHLVEGVFNLDSTIRFNPDAIIYTAHSNELQRLQSRFIDLVTSNVKIDDPFVIQVKKASGITKDMCMLEKQNRLKPFTKYILKWGYASIANKCNRNNIQPIWMYVPALGDTEDPDYNNILSLAKQCGFLTITINEPYKDFKTHELMVAPWDYHLNKKGHELVANKLFKQLTSHHKELKLN